MKKVTWILVLLISLAAIAVGLIGLPSSAVTLKPGHHITQAYHYYPDGTRCHCMVIAGMINDETYLDAHDFRIEDIDNGTCTLVFRIGESNELYCVDKYPLACLDYNRMSNAPGWLRPAIAISGWAALILSIVQLARTRKREA